MKKRILYFCQALLNSYAIIFFSQNTVLGALLIVVSFFNPAAGVAGLVAVTVSLLIVNGMGFLRSNIQSGLYTFNAVLLGIGLGTFYHINTLFWVWLLAACLLTVVLSVAAVAWLGKYGLPILSLPFIITLWLLLSAAAGYTEIGLLPKESYMLNELSAGNHGSTGMLFAPFNRLPLPAPVSLFLRALSALLFQDSVMAGLVLSIGLFVHSRIIFSLLALGFITALTFNHFTHFYPEGVSHYHLGVNFMMISAAIGGFFLIPSWRSYLWAMVSVPVAFLMVGAFTKLLLASSLPVLSLPFCVITIGLLYFFILRATPGKLQLTPVQYYSPETNLYQFTNNQERLQQLQYLKLNLPFLGSWMVSQGYGGAITHKADWQHALDFVITDDDGQTHLPGATLPEHFYCFSKPVLACADGQVVALNNHIPDNAIGEINITQNWGNCIVLKHTEGLYTQVSHLKQFSAKVNIGDYVKQGEILGVCGNSGRSPEPHLHFQVQALPYIGSHTIAYPFAQYMVRRTGKKDESFYRYKIPKQGDVLYTVISNSMIKQAFNLRPGYRTRITTPDGHDQTWEVHTDALNQTYLYSVEDDALAYFVNDEHSFYFTEYHGVRQALLYRFYTAAYQVIYSTEQKVKATGNLPLQTNGYHAGFWFNDLIAPFYSLLKYSYSSFCRQDGNKIHVHFATCMQTAGRIRQISEGLIQADSSGITGFTIHQQGKTTQALWHTESTY